MAKAGFVTDYRNLDAFRFQVFNLIASEFARLETEDLKKSSRKGRRPRAR